MIKIQAGLDIEGELNEISDCTMYIKPGWPCDYKDLQTFLWVECWIHCRKVFTRGG